MSTPTSDSRRPSWVGLVLGIVILGLIAAFAIALPKAVGEESAEPEGSTAELKLPDTLPGGYTAADLPEAFTGEYAAQADQISKQQSENREFGDTVLPQVLGTDAVTRAYATKDLTAVFVQAIRAPGGALAPDSLSDPESSGQTHASQELVAVDDAICVLQWGQESQGASADVPTYTQCQHSEDDLTVQVGGAGLAPADAAKVAGEVLADLQDQ